MNNSNLSLVQDERVIDNRIDCMFREHYLCVKKLLQRCRNTFVIMAREPWTNLENF